MFTALTGGIGSGKSTALKIFKKSDITVYDTDEMVHDLYENSPVFINLIKKRWNLASQLSGNDLKKCVAEIVFTQPKELNWLEQQIHPLITQKLKDLKSKKEKAIVAVPLLFELGLESIFDLVISISCPPDIQLKRLQARGWSATDIAGRLKRQLSMKEKERLADVVINNCDSLEFLQEQCAYVIDSYLNI